MEDFQVDEFFPGLAAPQSKQNNHGSSGDAGNLRDSLLHRPTQQLLGLGGTQSATHHPLPPSTIQQLQERKEKFKKLKQIARLEHQLLQKNQEIEEVREEIQQLKTMCDENYREISTTKQKLKDLLQKENPLVPVDFAPTTVEGTFELPSGIRYSQRVFQLKYSLDDLCLSTYHILKRHLPPLEQRSEEVQREIWDLSEELLLLQPTKAPIERDERLRLVELNALAKQKKDRLVEQAEQMDLQKRRILERLEAERQQAMRAQEERDKVNRLNQLKAEQRVLTRAQEEIRKQEEVERQKQLLEEQKERALQNVASIIALNRKRDQATKLKKMDMARPSDAAPPTKTELQLDQLLESKHEEYAYRMAKAKQDQEKRKLDIVRKLLDDEDRRRKMEATAEAEKQARAWKKPVSRKLQSTAASTVAGKLLLDSMEFEVEAPKQEQDQNRVAPPVAPFDIANMLDSDDSDGDSADGPRDPSSFRGDVSMSKQSDTFLDTQDYSQLWEAQNASERKLRLNAHHEEHQSESGVSASRATPSVEHRRRRKKSPSRARFAAFSFKPSAVEFRDYAAGKVYRKKVVITNTSGRVNTFQLLPVAFDLTPYFTFEYAPPGRMSAGMTSTLTVVFHPPMESEENMQDLLNVRLAIIPEDGELVSINMNCLLPKCLPDIACEAVKDSKRDANSLHVDFGKVSIGEKEQLNFDMFNEGFIGAKFWVTHIRSEYLVDGEKAGSDDVFFLDGIQQSPTNGCSFSGQIQGYAKLPVGVRFEPPNKCGRFRSYFGVDFVPPNVGRRLSAMESLLGAEGTLEDFITARYDIGREEGEGIELAIKEGIIHKDLVLEGEVVDLPIYAEKVDYDLKWLKVDSSYREKIVIRSRTSSAQRFSIKAIFEDGGVISEENVIGNRITAVENLGVLEISPNIGFVQPNEPFAVWIKFKPSLAAYEHFKNGEMPFKFQLDFYPSKHNLPVTATFTGRVTRPAIVANPTELDFGTCTIYDGIVRPVTLTSLSKLVNKVGFVDMPEYISVQPGGGFASLLPLESVERNITFMPKVPGNYSFSLTVKTTDGQSASIQCRGIASKPPIRFTSSSGNMVKYPNISVGSQSTVSTVIEFEDEDTLISTLARKKTACFEFSLPRFGGYDADGEPIWKWEKLATETDVSAEDSPISIYPRSGSLKSGAKKCIHVTFNPQWKHVLSQKGDEKDMFRRKQINWKIPCFTSLQGKSKIEVVFLEVHATVTAPLFKLSSPQQLKINFGSIPVHEVSKQNIFLKSTLLEGATKLKLRGLDPFGPFTVTEEPMEVQPNNPAKYIISFQPKASVKYFETFDIASNDGATRIRIKIMGEGVLPSVIVEPRSRVLVVGDTLLGEYIQNRLVVHNVSTFSTTIRVRISDEGSRNFNGLFPFECSPSVATIAPGKGQEVTVTFKPDHESEYMWADAVIDVEGFKKPRKIKLVGRCWSSSMFLACDQETTVARALGRRGRDVEIEIRGTSATSILAEELKSCVSGKKLPAAPPTPALGVDAPPPPTVEQWVNDVAGGTAKGGCTTMTLLETEKMSLHAVGQALATLSAERGTGLNKVLGDNASPGHPLLRLSVPLTSMVQESLSSRYQFLTVPCPWVLVSNASPLPVSAYANTSGTVLTLSDANAVTQYPEPLFRVESRHLKLANLKPGSPEATTSMVKLPDAKKLGTPVGTFKVELMLETSGLHPAAQAWLQRERAGKLWKQEQQLVTREHGLRFTVAPAEGTLEFGASLPLTISMVGPKGESLSNRHDLEKLKPATTSGNSTAPNAQQQQQQEVSTLRMPLYVETLLKVTLKGGVQVVERVQGQPAVDGAYKPTYNVVLAGVEGSSGSSSAYSETFAKQVSESTEERVWLLRIVTAYPDPSNNNNQNQNPSPRNSGEEKQ